MFSDAAIEAAARWLADQQRECGEDRCAVPLAERRPVYYEEAFRVLGDRAREAEAKGFRRIGASVYAGFEEGGSAVVRVFDDAMGNYIFGYMPKDGEIPSFIWPPEVEQVFRERWRNEPARER